MMKEIRPRSPRRISLTADGASATPVELIYISSIYLPAIRRAYERRLIRVQGIKRSG